MTYASLSSNSHTVLPLKRTLALSLILSGTLFAAAPVTPDSGTILTSTPTENKLPTTLATTVEQSGFRVIAAVMVDGAVVLDAPSKDAKVLQTLKKEEKIKLNGLEKSGFYLLESGGYVSKSSVVIVSKLSSVTVSHRGDVRMNDPLIEKTFAHYTKDGISANSTDSALSAVKRLGGLDAAVFLKPDGENYNATLGVVETKAFSAYISEDNYGDHITGRYRTSLGGSLNDKFGYGEKFFASLVTTGNKLIMGSLEASLPISDDASTVSLGVSRMHYSLGDTFSVLDATGTSTSFWGGYTKPLWLSYLGSAEYNLKISRNVMVDKIDVFSLTTDKSSTTMDNTLSFYKQDGFMDGGTNGARADLRVGRLSINDAGDPYHKEGSYAKLNLDLQRVQRLGTFTGIALISGQKAFKNLDSSEKFNLTGVNAVGGYYTGDIVGDEGFLASLEIDHAIPIVENLNGGLIYTTGAVWSMYSPINPAADNTQSASSIGAKLSYTLPYDIAANAALYKRVSGDNVNNYDNPYHFLFNVTKKF